MTVDDKAEKFNIENTDTIDSLAYEQETSSLILLLADGMDWSDMNRHLLLLQEKLNTYIWYIDSRQYEEKYPVVKRIELRVSFLFQEPEICHKLLERAKLVFMNAFKNVEIIVEGEKLPLDKYEGIPNDYIGRRSDWEWPEED